MQTRDIPVAARGLLEGKLVAFPTETVYGLGADAENEGALLRLFKVKGRPKSHPVIVHINDLSRLDYWAKDIPDYVYALEKEFWPGPMTLLLSSRERVSDLVTGGQNVVGVRFPSDNIARQLLEEFHKLGGNGVAAPSANRFGKVSPTSADAVLEELLGYTFPYDILIDGGKCRVGIESTIIDCTSKFPRILRPGAITREMVSKICIVNEVIENRIYRAPGTLRKHYSPRAKVSINQQPKPGEGLIALSSIETPDGVFRLCSPNSIEHFAQDLYSSFRLGDRLGLKKICVLLPNEDGLVLAIKDRVSRASSSK